MSDCLFNSYALRQAYRSLNNRFSENTLDIRQDIKVSEEQQIADFAEDMDKTQVGKSRIIRVKQRKEEDEVPSRKENGESKHSASGTAGNGEHVASNAEKMTTGLTWAESGFSNLLPDVEE